MFVLRTVNHSSKFNWITGFFDYVGIMKNVALPEDFSLRQWLDDDYSVTKISDQVYQSRH